MQSERESDGLNTRDAEPAKAGQHAHRTRPRTRRPCPGGLLHPDRRRSRPPKRPRRTTNHDPGALALGRRQAATRRSQCGNELTWHRPTSAPREPRLGALTLSARSAHSFVAAMTHSPTNAPSEQLLGTLALTVVPLEYDSSLPLRLDFNPPAPTSPSPAFLPACPTARRPSAPLRPPICRSRSTTAWQSGSRRSHYAHEVRSDLRSDWSSTHERSSLLGQRSRFRNRRFAELPTARLPCAYGAASAQLR